MKIHTLPIAAILLLTLFSASPNAIAGPSTYTENANKQTGKMVVAQFNYPGHGTLSALMAPAAPGVGYALANGTVLVVSKVKSVKSSYPVPANYNSTEKRLYIPGLIVINQGGWSYYDVTLVANSGDVDSMGFPIELIVTDMVPTQLGEPAPTPLPTSTPVPTATPAPTPVLSCVITENASLGVPAGGTMNVNAPACPAGYVATSTNCGGDSWQMPIVYISGGTCSAQNNGAGASTLRASRTCCKVQ